MLLSHVFGEGLIEVFFVDKFADGSTPKNVQKLLKLGRLEAAEKHIDGRRTLVGFRRRGSRRREDFYPLAVGIPLAAQKPRPEESESAPHSMRHRPHRKGTGMKYQIKDGETLGNATGGDKLNEFEKMDDGSFESVSTNDTGTTITVNIAADSIDATKLEAVGTDTETAGADASLEDAAPTGPGDDAADDVVKDGSNTQEASENKDADAAEASTTA